MAGKDYTSLQSELAGDLASAAASVSMSTSGGKRQIKLKESALPNLVPSNSVLQVQATKFTDLKMGDVICVSIGREMNVRRFVKLKMTAKDTLLLTAYEGFDKKEALPKGALLGLVVAVNAGGETFDPRKKENPFSKFWGKLTEYGTHKPFGLFSAK